MKILLKKRIICLAAMVTMCCAVPAGLTLAAPDSVPPPGGQGDNLEFEDGHLDYIHPDNTVVINDIIFTVTKQSRFYTSSGAATTLARFHEGDSVKVKSFEDNIIDQMYKVASGQSASAGVQTASPKSKQSSEKGSKLHQENGVWKN